MTTTANEQKATAAGDVRRLQTDAKHAMSPSRRAVRPFKPILTTSWFGNKVNNVLLVLQLKVIAPTVEMWSLISTPTSSLLLCATLVTHSWYMLQ